MADLLGQLFPRFAHEWSDSTQAASTPNVAAGRLANSDYFDRYFALGVPGEDLPDRVVAAACGQIADDQPGAERQSVEEAWPQRTNLILSKLQQHWLPGSPRSLEGLLWLTRNYTVIPERNDMFGDPQMRVHWFGRELYSSLSGEDAAAFATQSTTDADDRTLRFIAMMATSNEARSHMARDEHSAPGFEAAQGTIAQRIAERFAAQADANPLHYPDDVWSLFWAWRELHAEGPREWAIRNLDGDSWPALDLVARMISTSIALGVRNPVRRLSELDLTAVTDIIGTERLMSSHGDEIAQFEGSLEHDAPATTENRRKFALIRLRALLPSPDRTQGED